MKIVGFIAEYNPFHNGHFYHIQKALEVSKADSAVVVMSGDYVQRGAPALLPKRFRAQAALECGAAAVLELPVCYATGSAELFALGAVSLLDALGVVDSICFGSECGDIQILQQLTDLLYEEPTEYQYALKKHLKNGVSFPAARQLAASSYFSAKQLPDYSSLLSEPNNILGIEYLKALKKIGSPMQALTIQRMESSYHDTYLQPSYSSASAIRALFTPARRTDGLDTPDFEFSRRTDGLDVPAFEFPRRTDGLDVPAFEFSRQADRLDAPDFAFSRRADDPDFEKLAAQVPDCHFKLLKDEYQQRYPVFLNDFSLLLKYKLLGQSKAQLTEYQDVSEDLANRIYNHQNEFIDYTQFAELLKTKELTQTRIFRALLHILLDVRENDVKKYLADGVHYYARLLGFREDSAEVVSRISKMGRLPLLTQPGRCESLSDHGRQMLERDIFASNLYHSVITDKYHTPFENEYSQAILKV